MKKIFYSMIAVALCSCAQSEVDDNTPTPPQPAKNGLKFEVVNDGFTGEDGTRVKYGDYGTASAYQATFENGDEIGIFAINTTTGMETAPYTYNENAKAPVDEAYIEKVKNAKLTLKGGVWELTDSKGNPIGLQDFGAANLLFAYAPYDPNKTIPSGKSDGRPSFIQNTDGTWDIYKKNSRFFTSTYGVTDNGTAETFKKADMMGAVAKVPTSTEEKVSFNMIHMRGMVEVTVDRNVELTSLSLVYGSTPYEFTPYLFTTTSQKVYRVLTTEYRDGFTVKATITDKEGGITKKYKKTIPASDDPGKCSRLNIPYAKLITVDGSKTLATVLEEKYGNDYATTLKSLRLAGTLSPADWTTLKGLTNLKKLDMSQLNNTEIPSGWLNGNKTLVNTLTTLILPNNLETIPWNSLQVKNVANIDIPATVTTIGQGAFYYCENTSFCIPNDSQLTSIGDGAFWNAKAVYTDAIGVLKMPTGVTEILANAFFGVKNLNKIIFQSPGAPAITNGANQTIENNVLICVPNSDNYKNKGLFPGNAVFVNPLPLTADNYTAISTGEGSTANLCDGIISAGNYWHSRWQGNAITYDKWGIYIDIALPTEQTSLKVFYTNRSGGNNYFPKKVAIGVKSEETEEYTELFRVENTDANKPLKEGAGASTVLESAVAKTDGSSYKYVRFAILQANGVAAENAGEQKANAAMATLAELMLAKDAWIE